MTVGEAAALLGAKVLTAGGGEIRGGFVCDVMSRAMAQGFSGMAWITRQANMNALAVAVMTDAACLIFPAGVVPEETVIQKAREEGRALLCAAQEAFEIAGMLYAAGLRGEDRNG